MEQYMHQIIADWGYWGIFFIILLDNMNVPFPPTEVILSMTGWFIARGIFNFWMVYLVSTVAGTIGCILFYCIIRVGHEKLMPKLQKWMRISDKKLDKANRFFFKYGGLGIFLGRLIPGMRTISLIPAGIFNYPFWKFVLYVALGTALWNGGLLFLGHVAGNAVP